MISLGLFFLMLLNPLSNGRDFERTPTPEQLETRICHLINEYRASLDLGDLAVDERLARQARDHSRRMAAGKVDFGHEGFKDRIKKSGIRNSAAAENVGMNLGMDDPAEAAVRAWLNSSGHRSNIEGRYNLTGIGAARARDGSWFFTQLFVRGRKAQAPERSK